MQSISAAHGVLLTYVVSASLINLWFGVWLYRKLRLDVAALLALWPLAMIFWSARELLVLRVYTQAGMPMLWWPYRLGQAVFFCVLASYQLSVMLPQQHKEGGENAG